MQRKKPFFFFCNVERKQSSTTVKYFRRQSKVQLIIQISKYANPKSGGQDANPSFSSQLFSQRSLSWLSRQHGVALDSGGKNHSNVSMGSLHLHVDAIPPLWNIGRRMPSGTALKQYGQKKRERSDVLRSLLCSGERPPAMRCQGCHPEGWGQLPTDPRAAAERA